MIKITNESFIQKAIKKHGDKYGYKKVKYTGNRNKVKIKCKKHGYFEQRPNGHLVNGGCHLCGDEKKVNISNNKFIQKAKEKHDNLYNYDKTEYTGSHNKIIITCNTHGDFTQQAASHLRGAGCMKCSHEKRSDDYLYSQKKWKQLAKKKHNGIYGYKKVKYTHSQDQVKIKCKIHGYFKQVANAHLGGNNCPLCAISGFKSNKPAELYLYNINGIYLGYGITGNLKKRHVTHVKNLTKAGFNFKLITSFSFENGRDAWLVEKYIKTNFNSLNLGVVGFKKECISIEHLDILLTEIPALIEKHDKRSV